MGLPCPGGASPHSATLIASFGLKSGCSMKLSVKILGGVEYQVEAAPEDTVEHLKAQLQLVQGDHHKFLFRGKALQGGTPLSEYHLTDGCKITLVVKRKPASDSLCSSSIASPKRSSPDVDQCIQVLRQTLQSHFRSAADVDAVLKEFSRRFEEGLLKLSLDDWERICSHYFKTKTIRF